MGLTTTRVSLEFLKYENKTNKQKIKKKKKCTNQLSIIEKTNRKAAKARIITICTPLLLSKEWTFIITSVHLVPLSQWKAFQAFVSPLHEKEQLWLKLCNSKIGKYEYFQDSRF